MMIILFNCFFFVPLSEKMANIPLSRSEVFGELRKELHEDKEFHQSDVHVFIIMGASVRAAVICGYRTVKWGHWVLRRWIEGA